MLDVEWTTMFGEELKSSSECYGVKVCPPSKPSAGKYTLQKNNALLV